MITLKNIQTGDLHKVCDTRMRDGRIITDNNVGERFINKHSEAVTVIERTEDGRAVLSVNDGWEIVSGSSKKSADAKRTPKLKAEKKVADDATPTDVEKVKKPVAVEAEVVDDAKPVEKPVTADDDESDANEQALIAAIKNLKGGAVDIKKVREIVAEEFARLATEDPKKAAKVLARIKKEKGDKKEVYCKKFARIVAKVARGNNVYLFGPAGSGKSHTAEQVARELGLDFYGQTTIQFAHDVRGYGDAGGNFQETPFFKAFAHGGLYFQDEYDRSNAEAAIVLNSALANGWYDFPIVGRVVAHPNFRFMAAGNTTLTGATEEYVTGQEIDASSRDRFAFFFEVDYSKEVELYIAHGDRETVDFVWDVRRAIKQTGVKHVVSYRATAAMTDERENENDREACIVEAVFKGLEVDERSMIYGALRDTSNPWAVALSNTLK